MGLEENFDRPNEVMRLVRKTLAKYSTRPICVHSLTVFDELDHSAVEEVTVDDEDVDEYVNPEIPPSDAIKLHELRGGVVSGWTFPRVKIWSKDWGAYEHYR